MMSPNCKPTEVSTDPSNDLSKDIRKYDINDSLNNGTDTAFGMSSFNLPPYVLPCPLDALSMMYFYDFGSWLFNYLLQALQN